MESTQDKLIRYLQDAHAAEVGTKKALEGMLNDDKPADVKALVQQHVMETDRQAQRLEQRLRALGSEPSDSKGFFNSMFAKVSEMMNAAHDREDQNTQDLIKAYATEHLERGMYESLIAFATAIGDNETAQIARQNQAEEEATAQKLWPLIASTATSALQNATGGARLM